MNRNCSSNDAPFLPQSYNPSSPPESWVFFLFLFISLPNTPFYHSIYLFPERLKKSENIANQEICVYNWANEDSKDSLLGNTTALSGAMFCCLFTWWEKSHFEEYFSHKTFFFLSSSFAAPASGNIYFPHTAQMN